MNNLNPQQIQQLYQLAAQNRRSDQQAPTTTQELVRQALQGQAAASTATPAATATSNRSNNPHPQQAQLARFPNPNASSNAHFVTAQKAAIASIGPAHAATINPQQNAQITQAAATTIISNNPQHFATKHAAPQPQQAQPHMAIKRSYKQTLRPALYKASPALIRGCGAGVYDIYNSNLSNQLTMTDAFTAWNIEQDCTRLTQLSSTARTEESVFNRQLYQPNLMYPEYRTINSATTFNQLYDHRYLNRLERFLQPAENKMSQFLYDAKIDNILNEPANQGNPTYYTVPKPSAFDHIPNAILTENIDSFRTTFKQNEPLGLSLPDLLELKQLISSELAREPKANIALHEITIPNALEPLLKLMDSLILWQNKNKSSDGSSTSNQVKEEPPQKKVKLEGSN
jgi:hypothetical protein